MKPEPLPLATESPASIAVDLQDVHLTLGAASGAVEILRGIDFTVRAGQSVAIVGPSGSGKSSMISVAAGLERATSGSVRLLGEDISARNEDQLAKLRRGRATLIFQSFHLLPTLSALDNVRTPLEIAGIDDAAELARAALDDVRLSDRLHHFPGQLSGGEQQRVAVARALACNPAIVFADEPTGNLDTKTGEHVADLLFDLTTQRGAALILVTHDDRVAARAQRTLTMRSGKLC